MTDDLVRIIRWYTAHNERIMPQHAIAAADRIEKLEAVTKDDARWLAAYHLWCAMKGCAPSSSDLIAARKILDEKAG